VAFILAVGGRDHQQITHGQHFAIGGFMRKDTQSTTHIQLPYNIGRSVVVEHLLPIGPIVLAITETLCVEATELALSGDIVQPVPFHIRRTGGRSQQELSQTSLYSRGHVLPKEFAILRSKCGEHPGFFLIEGVQVPCVVGAYIDCIASNHGTTKRLVSQLDTPDDVPAGGCIPINRGIARLDDCWLKWGGDGRRGHNV
jgi:hypothetical protein